MLSRLDGEFRVTVESDLSAREVADQSVEEGHHVVLAEEPQQAIGNDHRWSVRGDGVQPIGFRNVGADVVSVAVCGYQALSSGDHGRVVDVVPVDGGRRPDPNMRASSPVPRSSPAASGWWRMNPDATSSSFLARSATLRMKFLFTLNCSKS